jgi:hypothetical protein
VSKLPVLINMCSPNSKMPLVPWTPVPKPMQRVLVQRILVETVPAHSCLPSKSSLAPCCVGSNVYGQGVLILQSFRGFRIIYGQLLARKIRISSVKTTSWQI